MLRDPNGIRPAFYYYDDEILVAASERPAIQTAFKVRLKYVKELPPGHALIIKKDGRVSVEPFTERQETKACSFERIYFSRGTDKDIYLERKSLGEQLTDQVLKAIDYDFANTVFSYVPNTAETAFFGLMEGVEKRLNAIKKEKIIALGKDSNPEAIEEILAIKARFEKIVVKDAKMRTFIADSEERGEMVSHVYDVTYGIVRNNIDTLVLVDDSIVRGTTLRDSIITMVDRLHPRRIVFVSSAPQIRYPDCYGIDMSVMGNFVAFEAMVALLKQHGKQHMLDEVYGLCKEELKKEGDKIENKVKILYDQFGYEEVSQKISEILTPASIDAEVKIIFQTLDGLRVAVPNHRGDWYFSGDYPTPGGQKVVNKAFINFMEKKLVRAYF
jgi:amidophosphoribosyltransferase